MTISLCSLWVAQDDNRFHFGEQGWKIPIQQCRPSAAAQIAALAWSIAKMGSPRGRKAQSARRRDSHFAIERRASTKPHVDLVQTSIVHERNDERTFRDLDSVCFREEDTPTDPTWVLDGN